ncbi:MAG: hypothetical protein K6357_02115 [Elusimicrobiota bacterium]
MIKNNFFFATKNYIFFTFSIILLFLKNNYAQDISQKISGLIFASYDIEQSTQIIEAVENNIGGIQLQWGNYSPEFTRKTTKKIYEKSPYLPPLIAIDYEGGSVYLHQTHGLFNLPSNMAIGKAREKDDTITLFYLLGLELRKLGINTAFSPIVDVNTEKYNPIINVRSFSENKDIVTEMGEAVVDGFSSSQIITTLKHFPGHGMSSSDSHLTLPVTDISPIILYETHIYPFKTLIEKGKGDIVMLSHIVYKSIDDKFPASLSEIIIKNILKQQLNFKGIIITDSLDMKAITKKYSIEDAAVLALKNGCDMVLIGKYSYKKVRDRILKAIKNKEIDIKDIENAYQRIVEFKKNKKLDEFQLNNDKFDMAYKDIATNISYKSINISKNENKLIPLNHDSKINMIFFAPQRFSQEAILPYRILKSQKYNIKLTLVNFDSKINIEKLKKDAKNYSILLIADYSWPKMTERRKKIIDELSKDYKKKIFVNLINPVNSELFAEEYDAIIETYGINEFSMKALALKLLGESLSQN